MYSLHPQIYVALKYKIELKDDKYLGMDGVYTNSIFINVVDTDLLHYVHLFYPWR
jgi:hypothetical protein